MDDGVGLPPNHRAGVGIASMRERVAELGGSCTIESPPEGGTRVLAILPASSRAPGWEADRPAAGRRPPGGRRGLTSMPHTPIRVLVADDHRLFRDGLRALLELRARPRSRR